MNRKSMLFRLCFIFLVGSNLSVYSQNESQRGSESQYISTLDFTLSVGDNYHSNTQQVTLSTDFTQYKMITKLSLYYCGTENFDEAIPVKINPARSQALYAWEYGQKKHVIFHPNTPGNITASPLSPATNTFMAGDFAEDNNSYYAIDHDVDSLLTVDIFTGQENLVAPIVTPYLGKKITGMAYDHSAQTMYVVSTDSVKNSWLYTIDLNDGNLSLIGAIGFPSIANLGDAHQTTSRGGSLYGIDVNSNQLISISKTSGQGTIVGSIQTNITGLMHGMDYDATRHKMYVTITRPGKRNAEVGEVNLTSGAVQNLKAVGNASHLSYAAVHPFEEPRERTVCIPPPDPDPMDPAPGDSTYYKPWINKRHSDSGNPLILNVDVRTSLGEQVIKSNKTHYYQLRIDRKAKTDDHGWKDTEWVYWGTIDITIEPSGSSGG